MLSLRTYIRLHPSATTARSSQGLESGKSRVNTTWEPVSALRYHESCVDELLPGLEDITLLSGEGVVYLLILEESRGLSFCTITVVLMTRI